MVYFDYNQYYMQSIRGGDNLYIKKDKVIGLMNKLYNGNYNEFARVLGLNVAHLYRTLKNQNSKAGPKFLGALAIFCKDNNLDYNEYIFLSNPLTGCNDNSKTKTG